MNRPRMIGPFASWVAVEAVGDVASQEPQNR